MITFVLKFFKTKIKSLLVEKQPEILLFLNDKIDLPKLDEDEEQKILTNIYEALYLIIDKFI